MPVATCPADVTPSCSHHGGSYAHHPACSRTEPRRLGRGAPAGRHGLQCLGDEHLVVRLHGAGRRGQYGHPAVSSSRHRLPQLRRGKEAKADAKHSPITLGWVNVEGGPGGSPEATLGAQAAVKYVNDKLGGIGGHPLRLNVCTVVSARRRDRSAGSNCSATSPSQPSGSATSTWATPPSTPWSRAGSRCWSAWRPARPSPPRRTPTAPSATCRTSSRTWGTYARDVLKAKSVAVVHTNTPGDKIASTAACRD